MTSCQPFEITAPWLFRIVAFLDHYYWFQEDNHSQGNAKYPCSLSSTVEILLDAKGSSRHYCLECGQDMGPYSTTRQLCGKRFCDNALLDFSTD
jgi:hypothetical protein